MKTFQYNLERYQQLCNLSKDDIVQQSGLTDKELTDLANGTCSVRKMYQFCLNTRVKYTSIYSDEGFSRLALEYQYSDYPERLKKTISLLFCKALIDTVGSEEKFRDLFKPDNPNYGMLITKWLSSKTKCCIGPLSFELFEQVMEPWMTQDEVKQMLANIMYSRIANYNFNLCKTHSNVSYENIAKELNTSGSNCSNWGGVNCLPIPSDFLEPVANLWGFKKEEFISTILTKKMLKDLNHQYRGSYTFNLPEPPSDEKRVVKKLVDTKPEKVVAETENLTQSIVSVEDGRVAKMYRNLSKDDKRKVDDYIAELFFAAL